MHGPGLVQFYQLSVVFLAAYVASWRFRPCLLSENNKEEEGGGELVIAASTLNLASMVSFDVCGLVCFSVTVFYRHMRRIRKCLLFYSLFDSSGESEQVVFILSNDVQTAD